MKKLMAFVLAVVCVSGLIGCSNTSNEDITGTTETTVATNTTEVHVVDIWDQTTREQIACASALEKFWEDETTEYYLSCIKSQYILVRDNTGRTVDIVTALNEGLATIADLDHYGIKYYAVPKK